VPFEARALAGYGWGYGVSLATELESVSAMLPSSHPAPNPRTARPLLMWSSVVIIVVNSIPLSRAFTLGATTVFVMHVGHIDDEFEVPS
jgi:hypothetical protein